MPKYQATIIPPEDDKEIEVKEFAKAPTLAEMQAMVGGLIENVPHLTKLDGRRISYALVDEEGLLKGKPFNARATGIWLQNLGKGPFAYEPRLVGTMAIIEKVRS